jgi:hypothetical protein
MNEKKREENSKKRTPPKVLPRLTYLDRHDIDEYMKFFSEYDANYNDYYNRFIRTFE